MKTISKLALSIFLTLNSSLLFAQIPYLDKTSGSPKLMVAGKPFLILGSEMHNSTGSDTAAMTMVMKQAKDLSMNTVLGYAYWESIEPVEGHYNFDLVDALINRAKKENLKVILVWFGAWKSTTSSYVPEWVKTNPKRFPRYTLVDGKSLEILSPFSDENKNADAKAYAALMQHLKEFDKDNIVIVMQTENEPGSFSGYRDYSANALKAWNAEVPKEVINYLSARKGQLFPALEKVWSTNGYKIRGNWEEVFGKSTVDGEYKFYTEELFMAYHYSKFINYVSEQGRKVLNLPTYCNGWLYNKKGFYPHATINSHVLDMYMAGGTALDFYSPNVYTIDYDPLFSNYKTGGNTLFIPESLLSPAGVIYSIAEYDAIGFAPYGIDGWNRNDEATKGNLKMIAEVNATLKEMQGLITSKFGTDQMKGAYIAPMSRGKAIEMGDYKITSSSSAGSIFSIDFGKSLEQAGKEVISFADLAGIDEPLHDDKPKEKATPPPASPFGGLPKGMGSAMIIQNSADEFYVVGYGVKLNFTLKEGIAFNHLGFLSIDEGHFKNEKFIATKRWNGDEQKVVLSENQLTVLKVRLYRL